MRVLCFLLLALGALTIATAQADDIDALNHFYQQVKSLSAHFDQTEKAEDGAVLRQSSGVFLLSRPSKFRWAYKKPYKQIIVSDGQVLKFYDVGLAQVTIQPVAETLRATPAQLLTGGVALQEAFKVHSGGEHDGLTLLQLTPRSQQSDFKSIQLGVRDGIPVSMVLADKLGQTTDIQFSDIKVNPSLSAAKFDIDIPDGVTVVDTRRQGNKGGQ